MEKQQYIASFDTLRMTDVGSVGGKNASLGEMISQLSHLGVRVPGGFATTAAAFRDFLAHEGLAARIQSLLDKLNSDDVAALAQAGTQIRKWIINTPLPERLENEIRAAYERMIKEEGGDITLAVRSSATAEDLPDASFAGQQETFLNIHGVDNVLVAIKHVFASLYNDRAISYRVHQGYAHHDVALSAGVQRMVRSDAGASGVLFTLDTESGFDQVVLITSAYGLGEMVVQGAVNPDEFYVYKPALQAGKPAVIRRNMGSKANKMIFAEERSAGRSVRIIEVPKAEATRFSLNDQEIEELARYALIIEKHYARPMDIEWGKDGIDGKLYILQARPETVQSRGVDALKRYRMKQQGKILVTGRAIGQRIGSGRICLVSNVSEIGKVQAGDVLVTDMTDPDWEPVMKLASAIVTNRGGRTCHAAIIARELGIPAVVGCGNATEILNKIKEITVSCSDGDEGKVYDGLLDFEVLDVSLERLPKPPVKISMNVANPELAFNFSRLPNFGVGLARLEFVIARMIGLHPKAALAYPNLKPELKALVEAKSAGYASPVDFYIDKMTEGVATLAAAFFPKPVIVRLSDFKSNEYSSLLGGKEYEPV